MKAVVFLAKLFSVFVVIIHQHTFCVLGIDPDVFRNITELVTSKGYPCEEYEVSTADGYILGVQRIPYGVKGHGIGQRPVVFLQHGLLCDSTLWVTNIVQDSLGFVLADAGYDVWLGNSRGNTYSCKHKTLSPDQVQFWNWSFDEMAQYDLPSVIDFILLRTGQDQINYIGHSQGTLIAFSALSQNQALNKKVKLFIALAPVAYIGHTETPLKILKDWPEWIYYDIFGKRDFLPSNWFFKLLAVTACEDKLTLPFCTNTLFIISGYDKSNLNQSRLPVYISHNPAGTSVKNMIHYLQAIKSGRYEKYDYGVEGNRLHYGQNTPPQYDLSKIKAPILLYSGGNDWLADPKDVKTLESKLRTKFNTTIIQKWNHLDFAWGIDARKILYNKIIQDLRNS